MRCSDETVGQAFRCAVRAKSPARIMDQTAALRSNPKRSVFHGFQREDAVVRDSRRIGSIESDESRTIEARETFGCADPQIAVWRLRDGLYTVLRKSVFRSPHAVAVFCARE